MLSALSLTAFAQQKKVAVYIIGDDEGVNKVLESMLVSAIARSDEYIAIERTAAFLAELSKEQNYQRTGAVDDDELSRLGKQFGVQYVCVAAVTEAFNEKYLSARLIDVESAQVERTASSSGAIQSLEGLINAANSVSSNLLVKLGEKQSNSPKVAVYVVKNETGKDIGRVLADKLVAGFTSSGRYIAIERTNSFLSQLSKEQNYQQSGAVDDNDLSRLGKQFGVDYVCVVEISDVFGEKFISARLIDVETAEVVNSDEAGGTMNTMNDCLKMTNKLATNLSKKTFKEQAEEARQIREAEEAEKRRLEEGLSKRKKELEKFWDQGYMVIKDYRGIPWMVCFEPILVSSQDLYEDAKYSKFGYSDWRLAAGRDVLQWGNYSDKKISYESAKYISNTSCEITHSYYYIYNEYLHYFKRDIVREGNYWLGSGSIGNYCKKFSVYNEITYWDGVDNRTFFIRDQRRESFDYNDYKPKEREEKTALTFLVRKL